MVLVKLTEGADADAVCREIFRFCDENVEERGKPVAVIAVDEIPLTGMGKNDFRALEMHYSTFDYTAWNP